MSTIINGAVQIPWYATGLRADKLEQALQEIAPIALRYGATHYAVYRAADDLYKFLQVAHFTSKEQFTAYWEGPEFVRWRTIHSGWYQVPVLYGMHDVVCSGSMPSELAAGGALGDAA